MRARLLLELGALQAPGWRDNVRGLRPPWVRDPGRGAWGASPGTSTGLRLWTYLQEGAGDPRALETGHCWPECGREGCQRTLPEGAAGLTGCRGKGD